MHRNLRLWSVISNESSFGKIGHDESGSKQEFISFYNFLATGIVPRHTYNFPGIEGKWLRFAIRSEKENDILLEVMEKWRAIHQSSL
ncbi:hypothetical protein P5F75_12030 [Caldifermentibacillus hisashii]|uniref:hypothetical protein n=1 Tax=Bacillaceae TaxID=186817 RepID=UPI001260253B|nr:MULTISPECIES: hypothetical protein [Bacillaceae]MED3644114.1 hypothetical protein [Caldifermentibacillus hisashii]